jgi:hypothetical protein
MSKNVGNEHKHINRLIELPTAVGAAGFTSTGTMHAAETECVREKIRPFGNP